MPYCSIFDEFGSCRRWLPDKGRWCKNSAAVCVAPITRISDTEARYMRTLAMDRSDSRLPQKLLDLAEDAHCARWHKTKDQIYATAYHWLKELQERPFDIPDRTPLPGNHVTSESQIQPRYFTRSATSAANTLFTSTQRHDAPSSQFSARRPTFSTLPSTPKESSAVDRFVHQTVRKPLGAGEWRRGQIYIFARASDPGFVKIGYTCNVSRRLREWQQSCGYSPILLYESADLPNVHRVEQLIFAELSLRRRLDMRCASDHFSYCKRRHNEWFEIDTETAIQVATFWTEWIAKNPYDSFGNLYRTEAIYTDRWLEYRLGSTRLHCPFGSLLPGQMNMGMGTSRAGTQSADIQNLDIPRIVTAVITADCGSYIKLVIDGIEYRAARAEDRTIVNFGHESGTLAQEPLTQSRPVAATPLGASSHGLLTDPSQVTQQPRSRADARTANSQSSPTSPTASDSESTSMRPSTTRSRSTAPVTDPLTAESTPTEPASTNHRIPSTTTSPYPRPAPPPAADHENECDICLDPLDPSTPASAARPTTCPQCRNSHWHGECISHWLRQASSCPLCRGRWTLSEESEGVSLPRAGYESDESSLADWTVGRGGESDGE